MTNNQLCNLLGAVGCLIVSISMGLIFFGVAPAIWGAGFGLLLSAISLLEYE